MRTRQWGKSHISYNWLLSFFGQLVFAPVWCSAPWSVGTRFASRKILRCLMPVAQFVQAASGVETNVQEQAMPLHIELQMDQHK